MKLSVNLFKEVPKSIGNGICVYGNPSEEILEWAFYNNVKMSASGVFTNFSLDNLLLEDIFISHTVYDYVDGFSPNLNKYLHLGHASNFVIAKALQKMGVGKKFIANLGDTVTGEISKHDALLKLIDTYAKYDYIVDDIFMASELVDECVDKKMHAGEYAYLGTKVFNVGDYKIVGQKSDRKYSYFYHDVVLAEKLKGNKLYLTGFEQKEHFDNLNKLYPDTNHLMLGLVLVDGKKMSSSEGNVIMFDDAMDSLIDNFKDDKLAWNVLLGYILKSDVGSTKNIDMKNIGNPKESLGLYLSYTLAKLKSAGLNVEQKDDFNSQELKYKFLKAKFNLQPHVLFGGIVDVAKKISELYTKHRIFDNKENQLIYKPLAEDLLLGMIKLGMFNINKV